MLSTKVLFQYYVLWLLPPLGLLALFLKNRYRKRLSQVPGPFLRSISTIPRIWSVYRGRSHETDLELHHKYGKVVRLAPNTLSVSDPAEVNQLYGITTKFVKSDFFALAEAYDEDGSLLPDPFVLRDKQMHARMKRNAANAYSLQAIVQMEPYVDQVLGDLYTLLDGYATNKQACDLGTICRNYAMDGVTSITLGRNFNYLFKGDTLKFYKMLDVFTDYLAIFGQVPWTHRFLLKNPRVAQVFVGDNASQLEMINFVQDAVNEGRNRTSEEGPMTFLQRLILNQKSDPKSLSDSELLTHALGNLAAGSDTTACALRAIIYYVLKDDRVYQKLREEIEQNLSMPVTFAVANGLPYLTACIREAMRMHPSVGMILGRTVPEGGATISGYYVGAGTEVGINPYVLHYDPATFPSPNTFFPERWLPSHTSEEHLKLMNRCFFTFGHGAHTCSGRHVSMLEITKMIPTLFLRYKMKLVNGGRDYRFQNRWFTPQEGLLVELTILN